MKKLIEIQEKLKAPKGQYNKFGKYNYRSLEDILSAVKPLLTKAKCTMTINDELVLIGNRYYIKATATITDTETNESVSNTAYAREPEDKKGMDQSQITGTASSYARKYACNGLFLIDDTKDADTDEYHEQTTRQNTKKENTPAEHQIGNPDEVINANMVAAVRARLKAAADKGKVMTEDNLCKWLKIDKIEDMTISKHNLFNRLMTEQGL